MTAANTLLTALALLKCEEGRFDISSADLRKVFFFRRKVRIKQGCDTHATPPSGARNYRPEEPMRNQARVHRRPRWPPEGCMVPPGAFVPQENYASLLTMSRDTGAPPVPRHSHLREKRGSRTAWWCKRSPFVLSSNHRGGAGGHCSSAKPPPKLRHPGAVPES